MKGILLIGLITIITLLLVILVSSKYRVTEGFGRFYDEQTPFTNNQRDYYHNRINRSLPTNTGLNNEMKGLGKALFSVDTYLNTNFVPENPPFGAEEDPRPGFRDRNARECLPIKAPKFLPERNKSQALACGWWYRDSDNHQSTAYLGTSNGPIDLDALKKQFPGGEWIWDLQKAQQLEDAKKCRRIRNCETADFYPKDCGFCPSLNKGVPIDNEGKSKYPNVANIACDKAVVRNPANCPKPEPLTKTVLLKDGTMLKSGQILPNGKPVPYGEPPRNICDANPRIGTLSRECLSMLARTVGYSTDGVTFKVINGDPEGFYTRLGPNNDFFMIVWRIFKNEAKYLLPTGIFGDGTISKAEATAAYRRIFSLGQNSPNARVKRAARWLVYGYKFDPCQYEASSAGPFDELCLERTALEAGCQRDGYRFPNPTNYGDYFAMRWSMVQRYFKDLYTQMNNVDTKIQKKATIDCLGIVIATDPDFVCSDDETYLTKPVLQNPSVIASQARIDKLKKEIDEVNGPTMKRLLNMKLAEMQKAHRALIEQINDAIARSKIPRPPKKEKSGVGSEVLWYSWNYDNKFNKAKYTDQPFWGRQLFNSKQFMPSFCTGGADFNPFNNPDRMAFKLRARMASKDRANRQFLIMTDDGLDVQIDKKSVLSKFHDQGPTNHTSEAFIVGPKPVDLEISWYENYGYACFQPKIIGQSGSPAPVSAKDVNLRVPAQFPLARWDFYLQADFERNQVLNSTSNGVSYGTVGGRKALVFDGPNPWIRITNPVRGSAFRSFAQMVYCTSVPGTFNRLFALRGANFNDWSPSVAIEGGLINGGAFWMGLKFPGQGYENLWIQSPNGSFQFNKWHHIVFAFDVDLKGGSIYVDGVQVAKGRNDRANTDYFLTQFYPGTCIGHSHYPFDATSSGQPFRGAIQYVHWFDYTMGKADCITDMKNGFVDPSVYPENPDLIEREITGGGNKVTFYSQCGYKGKATELSPGDYPFSRLMTTGYQNDTLQSVVIPKGYTVILWEHDIGGGRELRLTANTACLEAYNYMNTTSSCRIIGPSSGGQIKVLKASYGANCGTQHIGNRTDVISKACNGKKTCDYAFDYTKTGGDPAYGCGKDLRVEYTCDGMNQKVATTPAEAGFNGKVRLDC